jgi:hypothetical protein
MIAPFASGDHTLCRAATLWEWLRTESCLGSITRRDVHEGENEGEGGRVSITRVLYPGVIRSNASAYHGTMRPCGMPSAEYRGRTASLR